VQKRNKIELFPLFPYFFQNQSQIVSCMGMGMMGTIQVLQESGGDENRCCRILMRMETNVEGLMQK